MRHLFDSEKSKKSIRLVKQLQDLEDKAFEIEQRKRKQQELDDEAMARALQAEIESESSSTSPPPPSVTAATHTSPIVNNSSVNHSPQSRSSNGPPPLPVKPEAYNHSDTPRPLTPLYNMTSSTPSLPPRENRPKSYLPAYKSGVNVSIASPQVSAARPETPVISAAPNGLMNMPKPNYPQRKETPVQHNIPEPVPQYNPSSYPTYHPPSNITATPKPAASNTNAFYNYSGSNTSSANTKHQESRPTESAPSIVFDQQYPAMQPISTPNYITTASHSAPSLSHDIPMNEQHRPVMSTTPVSFDSRYNQEPKKHGGVTEPFHIINSNASHINNTGYPPSRENQQQQPYFPNNNLPASLLEGYPTSRPKRSSFVESSVTPQQHYHHQNASSATLLEGYPTSRPKRTSFVESSVTQRPPLGIYQNASTTHVSSTTNFQNVASSIPPNPPSSLNKNSLAQKPLTTDKTVATSSNNNNNNTTSHVKSTSQSSISSKPTRPLPPTEPLTSTTSLPVESKARPVSQKSAFSDSVLSLKPDESDVQKSVKDEDEDEDEWDVISPSRRNNESDNESDYDYSDMIYDRRNEPAIDPFADSFAVSHTPRATPPSSPKAITTLIEEELPPPIKKPVITKTPPTSKAKTIIIEPTLSSLSREDKVLDGEEEERRHVEKESQEIEVTPKINHVYQTPKINPIFYQTPATVYQTPKVDPAVYQTPHIDPAVYQTPHIDPAVYQTPHINQSYPPGDEVQQFFPTNILKAGAPPVNSYASEVSADDYGYYQEDSKNKNLPKLPEKSNKEDRHITVSSVNPGQRVWIRVHPTDTGKELAERIHIVASYKTQRVIKITTASGRSVPLDNSPVFEDWNEIVAFKEGEAWKVDWGMLNPSYIDIISEGKEFMKQLKANFKSS